MRTRTMLAMMAIAALANAGFAATVPTRDESAIEVNPPVRSVNYYLIHTPEREMALTLCKAGRVAQGSNAACVSAMKSVGVEVSRQLPLCCGLAE